MRATIRGKELRGLTSTTAAPDEFHLLECDDRRMYRSFREFYPFYLGEHGDRRCRRMHFLGSWLVVTAIVIAIATRNAWWLIAVPLCGYGCAWIGHFMFEKNKPATFRHPLYSLMGDWVMFSDILRGRVKL